MSKSFSPTSSTSIRSTAVAFIRKHRILTAFAVLPVAWFLVHTTLVIIDGLNDEIFPCDVAVIFGNKVLRNGTPSKRLTARLERGRQLYATRTVQNIIVSGGLDSNSNDEALVMQRWLVSRGIPPERIVMDADGWNSWATALNTKRICRQNNWRKVMLVSQYPHISRAKLSFRKAGFSKEDIASANARYWEVRDLYSFVREFPAYYRYLVRRQL